MIRTFPELEMEKEKKKRRRKKKIPQPLRPRHLVYSKWIPSRPAAARGLPSIR